MSLYSDLNVRPVINAAATLTRLGGSLMPPEVLSAMDDASRHFVDLEDLQRRVGERLATVTHNEAAYVATGAAAGIALSVIACMVGTDRAAMQRLPDTSGLKDEVVVFKSHRNGYDHAVRMTGARLVEIGTEAHTEPAELERALSERTAAFVWFQGAMTGRGDFPIETVLAICSARGVPVIVDAAAQLPPIDNLWRFTQLGATCAIFSGGKDLSGPQASGLIVGRRSLIEAIRPLGSPNQGFARPMKVGKEELVGLLAAVERYVTLDHDARLKRDERVVAEWINLLDELPGVRAVRSFPNEAGQPHPRCRLTLDANAGLGLQALIDALWAGTPAIAVNADDDGASLFLNPMTLDDAEALVVAERLNALLS
jgi:L-seryl-tRNA(Ser) seleniumtransferase